MRLASGIRIGSYEILGLLGSGGMGEVYRAYDTQLGRQVAVKILPEKWSSDPEALSRFEKEARLASSLNHPNIVTIHQIGQFGSIPYIVMELVDGPTLKDVLADGPMPLTRAAGLAA